MDPVAGIGLVASVIQIAALGIDTAKKCKEVYQHGSTQQHTDIEYTTQHLSGLANNLQAFLSLVGSSKFCDDEAELIGLARACDECASTLLKEIASIKGRSQSFWSALSMTARSMRKRSKIERLQTRLEGIQRVLDSSLLNRLTRRFDVEALRNDARFKNLTEAVQNLITSLAASEGALSHAISQQTAELCQHMDEQTHQLKNLHVDKNTYEEVKRSLFFPEINARQEHIAYEFDGFKDSFHWIFEGTEAVTHFSEPTWDNFGQWLRSGTGVYWINGKAGSGKSCLMHYICSNKRTSELLNEWCGEKAVLRPTFFFWSAGSRRQKSVNGLLRSLLYQLLRENQALMRCMVTEPIHEWTDTRLIDTLRLVLTQAHESTCFCMFVDGLDEFDGEYKRLVSLLADLADHDHVKVCVSGRPHLASEAILRLAPGLKLQDFTSTSIREYVGRNLLTELGSSRSEQEHREILNICRRVSNKAQGVFLWVVLAVRQLRAGLEDNVHLVALSEVVEELPPELDGMYLFMLQDIKSYHLPDAAHFFQVRLMVSQSEHWPFCVTLSMLYLAELQWGLGGTAFQYCALSATDFSARCRILESQIVSHTRGMLEVLPGIGETVPGTGSHSDRGKSDEDGNLWSKRVEFIHRTAQDFLLTNKQAIEWMKKVCIAPGDAELAMSRGLIAEIVQTNSHNRNAFEISHQFSNALRFAAEVEQLYGRALTPFLKSLRSQNLTTEISLEDDITQMRPCMRANDPWILSNGCLDPNDVETRSAALPQLSLCALSASRVIRLRWLLSLPRKNPDMVDFHSLQHSLQASDYRCMLDACLDCQYGEGSRTVITGTHSIAEIYLLLCCQLGNSGSLDASRFTMIEELLIHGANPMAVYEVAVDKQSESAWTGWLRGLLSQDPLSEDYSKLNADTLKLTKLFLSNGADINQSVRTLKPLKCGHKRIELDHELAGFMECFEFEVSATFILDEHFGDCEEYSEFRQEIATLVKTLPRWARHVTVQLGKQHSDWWKIKTEHITIRAKDSQLIMSEIELLESYEIAEDIMVALLDMREAREHVWRRENLPELIAQRVAERGEALEPAETDDEETKEEEIDPKKVDEKEGKGREQLTRNEN